MPFVLDKIAERRARRSWIAPSILRTENILKFGRHFIKTFPYEIVGGNRNFSVKLGGLGHESPIVVGVHKIEKAAGNYHEKSLASLNIGFEEKAVVIESMQGEEGKQANLDRFRQATGKPALNYLIGLVEKQAKRCGFAQTKISVAENLFYFRFPEILGDYPSNELRDYYSSMQSGELWEFGGKIGAKVKEIRARMTRLYGTVAEKMGYEREGDYFVKNI